MSSHELEDLLGRPTEESNLEVFAQARQLVGEAQHLSQPLRAELVRRLDAAWPEDGFSSLITREEGRRWSVGWVAFAWMTYGPGLDLDLPADKWAGIASSGVFIGDETKWLQRKWTPEATDTIVRLCRARDARAWSSVVGATPGRLSDDFVSAMAARLQTFDPEHLFDVERIAERLADEQRLDALRGIAEISPAFGDLLCPYLAMLGDTNAVSVLLQRLHDDLAVGKKADRNGLLWLAGASRVEYLPALFECLVVARRVEEDPFGASGLLESAIASIGGDAAIAGYDEIIASRPFDGAQFMRLQRDRIAQVELQRVGNARLRELAEAANVPLLLTNDDQ